MYMRTTVLALIAASTTSFGEITSIENGIVKNAPGINDPLPGYGIGDYVQGFTELSSITLTSDIAIQLGDGSAGILQAGTVVNSHLIYYDPTGPLSWEVADIDIEFDSDILGLIVADQEMVATNSLLGLTGLNYTPIRGDHQNYGPNGSHDFEFFSGSSLNVSLRGVEGDYFRVLTVAVPTPGSLALFGVAGMIGTRRRR